MTKSHVLTHITCKYTSSLHVFGLILKSVAHLRKRLSLRLWGLGGESLEWGGVKCASLCMACTGMVYS